jgi:hypothetical protein
MTLVELAFCCYCYACLTENDKAYFSFIRTTNGIPDVDNPNHRQAVLDWLNDWGCRHFAIGQHELAAQELFDWHSQFAHTLPAVTIRIWELTDDDFTTLREAYSSLANRTASLRRRGDSQFRVKFGPTGAGKILFSLRPHSLAPWDEPIRESLGYDGSPTSYIDYLRTINEMLDGLRPECEQNGFTLNDLPVKLRQPNSSVLKLIDEYYWMTITQKWNTPGIETLRNWKEWSAQG